MTLKPMLLAEVHLLLPYEPAGGKDQLFSETASHYVAIASLELAM